MGSAVLFPTDVGSPVARHSGADVPIEKSLESPIKASIDELELILVITLEPGIFRQQQESLHPLCGHGFLTPELSLSLCHLPSSCSSTSSSAAAVDRGRQRAEGAPL